MLLDLLWLLLIKLSQLGFGPTFRAATLVELGMDSWVSRYSARWMNSVMHHVARVARPCQRRLSGSKMYQSNA